MNIFKKKSLLYENDKEQLLFLKVKDLLKMYNCKIWRMNRPVDNLRVKEIAEYFSKNQVKTIPGQISGWVNEAKELEIYDGWHRFSAVLQTSNDMFCFVKINTSQTEDVINDFKNLNKSVNVPYLYLEDNAKVKKVVCQNIAKKLCELYPACISTSRYPRRQNFNRDNFIDMLGSLDIDFYNPNLQDILWQELKSLNFEGKEYVKKHDIKAHQKCYDTDFWLFYLGNDYIKSKLQSVCLINQSTSFIEKIE